MYNNPVTTFPSVADKLRHLGNDYYPSKSLKPINLISAFNPSVDAYRREFEQDARDLVNTRLEANLSSERNYLKEKYQAPKSRNRAGQPFFSTTSFNGDAFNEKLIGSGDVTYSSRMSNDERNLNRQKLLKRLSAGFETIAQAVDKKQNVELAQKQQNAIQGLQNIEIMVASIIERVNSGIIDGNVYRDLMSVVGFFSTNIAYFDNVALINSIINQVQDLIAKSEKIYTRKFTGAEQEDKETSYADTFINALQRFEEFLVKNRGAVGSNLAIRQGVARNASRLALQPLATYEPVAVEEQAPAEPGDELEPIEELGMPDTQEEIEYFTEALPSYSKADIIKWSDANLDYKPRANTSKVTILQRIAKLLNDQGIFVEFLF